MSLLKPTLKTYPYCDICKKGYGNGSSGLIEQYTLASGESVKAHKVCADYKDHIHIQNRKASKSSHA